MESRSELEITGLNPNESAVSSADKETKATESDFYASSFPTWSTRIRTLLAHLCLAMSFSTVLRFTFSLGLYGSAILIPYAVFRIVLGIPVVLKEIMLGRYVTGSFYKIYSICPFYVGIFAGHLLTTFLTILYKFCITTYLLKYMTSLFRGRLIWAQCEKAWSTISCFERKDNTTSFLNCLNTYNASFCESLDWKSSAMQYWENVITSTANSVSFGFSILHMIFAIALVIAVNYKGVQSLEKAFMTFVMIPLILALIVSLVTYLTPDSITGFQKIWGLNTTYLKYPEVWMIGLTDTVRALNIGLFALSFISCHGKFSDDIFYDALTVFSSDIFCFALSIPLLSMIKSFNSNQPLFKNDYDVYVWISEIFVYYPYPSTLWAFCFYLAMAMLELISQAVLCLSFFEAISNLFKEKFIFIYLITILGVVFSLLEFPLLLFQSLALIDLGKVTLAVICLDLITLEIFYGIRKFNDDFHFMMGYHPSFLLSCALFMATVISFVFSVLTVIVKSPEKSALYKAYILPTITVVIYATVVIIKTIKAYKTGDVWQAITINPNWGPSVPILKQSRIVFDSKTVTKEYMYRKELYKKPLMKPNDFSQQNIVHLI